MNLEVDLIAGVIKGGPPPDNLPAPRLIKIFLAGDRCEFKDEKKQMLEVVGPELQSIYDDMGIEVLLVDMQYGAITNPERNPRLAEYFLDEIKAAHQHSRGCFMVAMAGTEHTEGWAPMKFTEETYKALHKFAPDLDDFYRQDGDHYILAIPSLEMTKERWQGDHQLTLRNYLVAACEALIEKKAANDEIRNILKSATERQLDYALKLDPTGAGILGITRSWKGKNAPKKPVLRPSKSFLESNLPAENILHFEVEYKLGFLECERKSHQEYLSNLSREVLARLLRMVNASIESDPEIKSKKKMVQEIYAESLAHIALIRDIKPVSEDDDNIEKIKNLFITGKTQKHGPILIKGGKNSGKSGILSRIYESAPAWLESPTLRVVRCCTTTPRSAYSLELLRVLCEHIGFLSGFLDGNLPKDASFDPLYLNNWFGQIMRKIEEKPLQEQLVILIDDLHRLHPLECDIIAALSWLPVNLSPGVHFVATSAMPPELLRLTPMQKERLRNDDLVIGLKEEEFKPAEVEKIFDELERFVGLYAAERIGSILAATEYGLSETEILELVMPTGGDGPIFLQGGSFNFSNWCLVRRHFAKYLKVRVMSGRLLFSWSHGIRDQARKKYFSDQETLKNCHAEIAKLFFSDAFEVANDKSSPDERSPNQETPFQSRPRSQDTPYTLRHVEEAWLHLLQAGDVEKLKKLAVCSFDFLLAAVQMVSVSYLRCVLEHSRRYLLERDLELVYYTVRKSSDILTRDPLQLGAQLICWLRPVAEDSSDLVRKKSEFLKIKHLYVRKPKYSSSSRQDPKESLADLLSSLRGGDSNVRKPGNSSSSLQGTKESLEGLISSFGRVNLNVGKPGNPNSSL